MDTKHPVGGTPIVVVGSQKGGPGKTSVTLNLAGAWIARGRRILVVDVDSQGNLSQSLKWDGVPQVPSLFEGKAVKPVATSIQALDILAADRRLSAVMPESQTQGASSIFSLRDYLSRLRGYDLILIDTPPSLGGLTLSALVAASHVVIPVSSQYFSLKGTADMLATLARVRQRWNPGLELAAVVIAQNQPGIALSEEVVGECRRLFGPRLIETRIPRTIKVEESQVRRIPVCQAFPSSKVAQAYREVADEVWRRVHDPELQSGGQREEERARPR